MASFKKLKKYIRLKYLVNKKLTSKKNVFFFFPFLHIGGAETVHLDILNIPFIDNKICVITNTSANNLNQKSFKKATPLIEIQDFISNKYLKNIALKSIATKINKCDKPIIFGCNSHFFYDLIPYLNKNVKIIDLIHAFSYEEPSAAEKYSLNHVSRIDKRVVLGQKTLQDFKYLYVENNIDLSNLEKITIIKNKVSIPDTYQEKPNNKNLKILFVGRNSDEKRPELYFDIAKKCLMKNLNAEFIVLGDFSEYKNEIPKNLTLEGEINSKSEINRHYQKADIILITSSREGMPMVILEGMVYGVVAICTDVGEIPEIIGENFANGFLINNNKTIDEICNEFIEKIILLNSDRNLLKKFSDNSRLTIKENFNPLDFDAKYQKLFLNNNFS